MHDRIITTDELKDLTGYTKPSAQKKALQYMHVPFKERPDGSLVVYGRHAYGFSDNELTKREKQYNLNMDALSKINGQKTH